MIIVYAAFACVIYGFAAIGMRKAIEAGVNGNGLLAFYGAGAIAVAAWNVAIRQQAITVRGVEGAIWGLALGLGYAVGFQQMQNALALTAGAFVTVVIAIVSLNPLIIAAVEFGAIGVPAGANVKLIMLGVTFAVAGGILVSAGMPKQ